MDNVINTLRIQNFKSIRSAILHPRRVNLIIGQPNVGKSTLMEAMTLLGGRGYDQGKRRFMADFIRYEKPQHLFNDNKLTNTIRIESDHDVCLLGKTAKGKGFEYASFSQEGYQSLRARLAVLPGNGLTQSLSDNTLLLALGRQLSEQSADLPAHYQYARLDRRGRLESALGAGTLLGTGRPWQPLAVKSYCFRRQSRLNNVRPENGLYPPHGDNLVHVLEGNPTLRHQFADLFNHHGLHLRVRVDAGRLEIIKDLDGLSCAFPYSGSSDTLQRYGFYLAAIESNRQSVILLEEPGSNSYPTYVAQLGQRIATNPHNQFFVTTHSPYLFREVLENMVPYENRMPELAVFVAYYQDFETRVRQLTDEEVRSIRRDSLDVFYHLDKFVQNVATQTEQARRTGQLAALRRPAAAPVPG